MSNDTQTQIEPASEAPSAEPGLLNTEFITSRLTASDPWCQSHGSGEDSEDLGAGMLYYGLAYATKAKTSVCIGSGGGFVPRLMRQAQRDLGIEGSRTFLVDGATNVPADKVEVWGTPCWLPEDSAFRTHYPEVELVLQLTKDAQKDFFVPQGIQIDFLHIDGDHHYEGAKLDWDLFSPLVPDNGVITLHDTVNYREPCGVYRLVEEIRESDDYSVIDFAIRYGTAIVKKNLPPGQPRK